MHCVLAASVTFVMMRAAAFQRGGSSVCLRSSMVKKRFVPLRCLATTEESFVAGGPVAFAGVSGDGYRVGDYEVVRSRAMDSRAYVHDWCSLVAESEEVWVRGRVKSVRAKGNSCFLVLRALGDASTTLQACYFKEKEKTVESKSMLSWLGDLSVESVIDVRGKPVSAKVKSCSLSNIELQMDKVFVVSRAPKRLPFLVEDAGHSEKEISESKDTERPLVGVSQEARLDARWLDLRTPANGAIMKTRALICRAFRSRLDEFGFIEIQSPKLVAGESESGAGVFTTDYFGQTACLAQSPQLYKQMAIAGDLNRVYEIAPVFRAENSNTRRHLCEFTGLDFEMGITEHYVETIRLAYDVFRHIFKSLETDGAQILETVRQQFPSDPPVIPDEPIIIHFHDALKMLQEDDSGMSLENVDDLTTAQEIRLGQLVKEKYENTDFFVVDRYPTSARPFYTMPAPDDPLVSNSYDFFLRGQEICSGAQRVHDPTLLREQLKAKGVHDLSDSLEAYLAAFDHGAPPHAGCGFGLDRVLFLYLNLSNIRAASLFPRDPNRLAP